MLIIQRKAQRLDQMKIRARAQTGSADIAGIPMHFRRNQKILPVFQCTSGATRTT